MKVGDPIELSLTLDDLVDDKYIIAVLRADGVNYPSPIELVNIGLGTYYFKDPINLVFPINTFEVRAQYIVYNDPGHTELAEYDVITEDIYRLGSIDSGDIVTVINELKTIVLAQGACMTLTGIVDDEECIGVVEDDVLIGEVSDDETIGYVQEDVIIGETFDDDTPMITEVM